MKNTDQIGKAIHSFDKKRIGQESLVELPDLEDAESQAEITITTEAAGGEVEGGTAEAVMIADTTTFPLSSEGSLRFSYGGYHIAAGI
jgi:hypothetical protein